MEVNKPTHNWGGTLWGYKSQFPMLTMVLEDESQYLPQQNLTHAACWFLLLLFRHISSTAYFSQALSGWNGWKDSEGETPWYFALATSYWFVCRLRSPVENKRWKLNISAEAASCCSYSQWMARSQTARAILN